MHIKTWKDLHKAQGVFIQRFIKYLNYVRNYYTGSVFKCAITRQIFEYMQKESEPCSLEVHSPPGLHEPGKPVYLKSLLYE